MPVAFDSAASGKNSGGTGNPTFNITVNSANLGLLLVFISLPSTTSDYVSGVTFNGSSMTRFATKNTSKRVCVYSLVVAGGLVTGTKQIVVSLSSTTYAEAAAFAFTGVDQTTPVGTSVGSGSAFQNSPHADNVTIPANGMAAGLVCRGLTDSATLANGSANVQRQNETGIGSLDADYESTGTSLSWSWAGGQTGSQSLGVPINPAASGPSIPVLQSYFNRKRRQ
jgi:hypothetical protein